MNTYQKGTWRRDADGTFKVFIRGCEQLLGTKVEVQQQYGDPKYIEIIMDSQHFIRQLF